MQSLLLAALLLLSDFYRHCSHATPYTTPNLNPYYLPFMDDGDFTNLEIDRQYIVNPSVKLRCVWNSTVVASSQDSLLLDMDYNSLTCQPVLRDQSNPSAGYQPLKAADMLAFGSNLAVTAYLQNSSSDYLFPMQFQNNSTFSVPLNRSALSTDRGTPGLPWEVQVYASVLPPSDDYSAHYKNTFTLVDPISDPYYSWDWGDSVDWATVTATHPANVVFTVKNPCANQVALFVVPGTAGVAYFGKSYLKSLDAAGVKWYKNSVAPATCLVTGVAGYVRYVLVQTDTCGYFISNALGTDVYAPAGNGTTGNGTRMAAAGKRVVTFTHVDGFGTAAGLGYGDLANGGSGSWCYLRKNLQPSGNATSEPVNTEEPSDWISLRDSTTNQWSLVREPFNNTPKLYPAITAFKFDNSRTPRMNAGYSQRLFADLTSKPGQIVSAYVNTPTSTYYFLYLNQQAPTPVYALYSQALSDTLTSLPTARLIYKFPKGLSPAETPNRILSHPTSTDLFVLSPAVAWLLTSNGMSVKKLFDIRKSDPDWAIDNMLFAQNGTLSFFIARNPADHTASYKLYRGNSYYGGYLPITPANSDLLTSLHTVGGLLVDGSGGLHALSTVDPKNSSAFATTLMDTQYINLNALKDATGVAVTPTLVPNEYLSGTFSVVPFTRKFFMVVEWTSTADSSHVSQFTPADIGRMLVQDAAANTKGGRAHIVGFNAFDQTETVKWAASPGTLLPLSYIVMEAVAPFLYDASIAGSGDSTLAITFSASDRSVSLTTSGGPTLAQYSAIFAEQFHADGSLSFRGSFLVLGATSPYAATALLVTGQGAAVTVTVQSTEWKVFALSSTTVGSPVASWHLQDHWYCPYEFVANQSTIGPWDHHMDRGHTWNLTMLLRRAKGGLPTWEVPRKSKGLYVPNYLLHKAGNPWRLHVRSDLMGDGFTGWNMSYQIEEVGSDYNLDNAVTSLSFRMGNPTQGCGISAAVPVTVVSGCLRGSGLTYAYPDGPIDDKVHLNKCPIP